MKIFVLVLLVLIVAYPVAYYQTESEVSFTVEEKGVKRSSERSDKYLLYTDKGTFEITDLLFAGYFRSSDDYGKIRVKKKYKCNSYGWRNGFFSLYKNVKDCREIEQ